MKIKFLSLLLASIAPASARQSNSVEITVGSDIGWSDGVCYKPISNVRSGDSLLFQFGGHDVVKMASEQHLEDCDFSNGIKVAEVGKAPFTYTVTEQDASEGSIYFACSIGSHCSSGLQRLTVKVNVNLNEDRTELPTSDYSIGLSESGCNLFQAGTAGDGEGNDFSLSNSLSSECTEPILTEENMYYVSCLSGPLTLTPGGVINSARVLHFPFPTDRRVISGTRTWEFVSGDPIPNSGGMGVNPVPVNQLYVHHLSGDIVLGQGAEGIRRSDLDVPFVPPYGYLTGNEYELMVFHLIDLREVDEWLECIECRCRDPIDGTYLNFGGSDDSLVGGVNCCTNCTDIKGPTIDYRMRYNVSYSDVSEESVIDVQMLTADISPVVGKNLEFDVPLFTLLKPENQKEGDRHVQRLERTGPFNELFQMRFFSGDYEGPDTVRLLRCVGHLHIAALGMWLEDAETGEEICSGQVTYGEGESDKGFLTAISVENFDPPITFPSNRIVRLVSEYNATELHTGVMGMWFVFISSERQVTRESASLTVDFCENEVCDVFQLPISPSSKDMEASLLCTDTLAESPACKFGGACSCEELVNSEESTGCGGVYETQFGDFEVNSFCAKHCDACPKGCIDSLPDSNICSSTGVCSCEELVNSDQSTGCGGTYLSQLGMVEVNTYCTSYCNSCTPDDEDDLIEDKIIQMLEDGIESQCKYATSACSETLSNLYSCGTGQRRNRKIDPKIEKVLRELGVGLALKHKKLGRSSLHENEEDKVVQRCSNMVNTLENASNFTNSEKDKSTKTGPIIGVIGAILIAVFVVYKLVLETRGNSHKNVSSKTHHDDNFSDDSHGDV